MELTTIKNSIHEIRGKRVILDYELAKMYEVETRVLKQAVRRNLDRFPDDFMFELSLDEIKNLTSQIVMSSFHFHFCQFKHEIFRESIEVSAHGLF